MYLYIVLKDLSTSLCQMRSSLFSNFKHFNRQILIRCIKKCGYIVPYRLDRFRIPDDEFGNCHGATERLSQVDKARKNSQSP